MPQEIVDPVQDSEDVVALLEDLQEVLFHYQVCCIT